MAVINHPPAKDGDDGRKWLVRFRPNPSARLRLFCFPYAGVGASVFHPWSRGMHPAIEPVAVQFPGREGRIREKPFDRLSHLVPEVARSIRPLLGGPYAFFGHSLGALVAFEVARVLDREGAPGPARLFVSARRAPIRPDPHTRIHELPDAEFIEEVGRRWNGIPPSILRETELLELLLPTLRADVAVIETYAFMGGEPLRCPISAFGGSGDTSLVPEDLLGWKEHTRGGFRLRLLPGNHFFIREQQQALLDALYEDLGPFLDGEEATGSC